MFGDVIRCRLSFRCFATIMINDYAIKILNIDLLFFRRITHASINQEVLEERSSGNEARFIAVDTFKKFHYLGKTVGYILKRK